MTPGREDDRRIAADGDSGRTTEDPLTESEARFRGLFDNTISGVAIYRAVDDGADFEFTDLNSAAQRIEQTTRQAVLGRRVTDVFPGIGEMGLLEVFRRVWRSGRPEHHPVTVYRDERVIGWRENHVYRLPTDEIVAVYDDVTERKQAEEALRESEAGLRAVLDATPFPVALVDTQDDKIAFWSRSALDLFGHTAPTAAEWYEIAYPDPAYRRDVVERWTPFVEEARRSGRAVNAGEYRVACRDGSVRTCEMYVACLPDRLIVTFNDVTERARAEAEVHRLNAELEQRVQRRTAQLTAKNEELERFTYTVSHDLKAPLRGIAGYAAELDRKHRAGLSERADFCVTQILTATRNMDHLIEDLMRFTRLDSETVSTTTVDIHGLIQAILHDRALALKERHTDVTVDIPFAALLAWERGLAQALANLIDNAITYSREAEPPRLRIGGEESAAAWRLSVADNGVGFDMKYHDRIFGLFNRLVRADEYDGTGIGLAITKKVVEKQGGRVWAEATPGEGATFFVELPRPVQ